MKTKYKDFLHNKKLKAIPTGFSVNERRLNKHLMDFQHDCVVWGLNRGRAALFEDCGLGKTLQQLEWANWVFKHTKKPVLILAPLSVVLQTIEEGNKFNIKVNLCSSKDDVKKGINISNYEKIHKFDCLVFSGVVLDESSCLKSYTSKYRTLLIDLFKNTPYRLCCTATPSPNDYMELGNHAEFLGIMSRSEMLSMFFINDSGNTGTWRLKKHAVKDFWNWMCSWSVLIQKPSDLGYNDNGFTLPGIVFHEHIIQSKIKNTGLGIIRAEAKTLQERRLAKTESMTERVKKAASIVNESDEQWGIWCNLNVESHELSNQIPTAVEVKGVDTNDHKVNTAHSFTTGEVKDIISKSSIYGFGMNWQHCCHVLIVGLSDSYEEYYQLIRRFWRFGQENTVHVHIITSSAEGSIVKNIKRKEEKHQKMISGMLAAMSPISAKNIRSAENEITAYNPKTNMKVPEWLR